MATVQLVHVLVMVVLLSYVQTGSTQSDGKPVFCMYVATAHNHSLHSGKDKCSSSGGIVAIFE